MSEIVSKRVKTLERRIDHLKREIAGLKKTMLYVLHRIELHDDPETPDDDNRRDG
jgi:hypothetical protein